MEAHHFCRQVNEDFAQCALFDGNSEDANLNGIEYIISARVFDQLPVEERPYWHPHNGEILSGQLVAGSNFGGMKPPVWVVNVRAATDFKTKWPFVARR